MQLDETTANTTETPVTTTERIDAAALMQLDRRFERAALAIRSGVRAGVKPSARFTP